MNNSVKVAGVRVVKGEQGEFCALDLISLQFKQSKTTGKEYLAPVKASITTALSKELAETLVGETFPGKIIRRELPKAEYRKWVNPSTGEEMTITHENVYVSNEE